MRPVRRRIIAHPVSDPPEIGRQTNKAEGRGLESICNSPDGRKKASLLSFDITASQLSCRTTLSIRHCSVEHS